MQHRAPAWMVSWSPDGARLASSSEDGTVIVWDAARGLALERIRASQDGVWSVTWSPDGTALATGANDGGAAIFTSNAIAGRRCVPSRAPHRERSVKHLRGHTGAVWCTRFSPDGALVATGAADATVRIWDRETGACLHVIEAHPSLIKDLRFSPDGTRLATSCDDALVRIFDTRTWTEQVCMAGHTSNANTVDWTPDGKRLVTCSHDRTVRVWSAITGAEQLCIRAHEDDIDAAVVLPDGAHIASCSHDLTVRIWRIADGALVREIRHHTDEVEWVSVSPVSASPESTRLATASIDAGVRIFDLATGRLVAVLAGRNRAVAAVTARASDGVTALVQGDRTLVLLDRHGAELASRRDAHARSTRGLTFVRAASDGSALVSASLDGTARLWSTPGLTLAREWRLAAPAYAAATDPGQDRLAAGLADGRIELRSLANAAAPAVYIAAHTEAVYALAWSPDGTCLASTSRDGGVAITHFPDEHTLRTLGHRDPAVCAAWSPDGTHLATGGRDRVAKLWDRSGVCVLELRGHRLTVWGVGFSPDGRYIATSSFDTTVRIFDRNTGECLSVLAGHTREVSTLCWAADGRLLTGSRDGTLRTWHVEEEGGSLVAHAGVLDCAELATVAPSGMLRSPHRQGAKRRRA
jgi:WD40 repeat protein